VSKRRAGHWLTAPGTLHSPAVDVALEATHCQSSALLSATTSQHACCLMTVRFVKSIDIIMTNITLASAPHPVGHLVVDPDGRTGPGGLLPAASRWTDRPGDWSSSSVDVRSRDDNQRTMIVVVQLQCSDAERPLVTARYGHAVDPEHRGPAGSQPGWLVGRLLACMDRR